ncbi:MAG TPA: hypothetical protein EYG82_01755 [Sulfurovum sp.]|nr:hypothetical protein [Sulfurovum sp.]
MPENLKIEEVLRTAISKRKNCAFIFTGSRRNWLLSMFSSLDRPFYKLGVEHHLMPIDKKVFYDWVLENFAKKEIYLEEEAFSYLYAQAHGETRFIQLLAYKIFQGEDSLSVVNEEKVKNYIEDVIEGASSIPSYYNTFTIVQQNALKIVAKQSGVNIYSGEVLSDFGMAKASMQSAMKKLLEIGALYEEKDRYYFENVELGMWLNRV